MYLWSSTVQPWLLKPPWCGKLPPFFRVISAIVQRVIIVAEVENDGSDVLEVVEAVTSEHADCVLPVAVQAVPPLLIIMEIMGIEQHVVLHLGEDIIGNLWKPLGYGIWALHVVIELCHLSACAGFVKLLEVCIQHLLDIHANGSGLAKKHPLWPQSHWIIFKVNSVLAARRVLACQPEDAICGSWDIMGDPGYIVGSRLAVTFAKVGYPPSILQTNLRRCGILLASAPVHTIHLLPRIPRELEGLRRLSHMIDDCEQFLTWMVGELIDSELLRLGDHSNVRGDDGITGSIISRQLSRREES
mmetsp:Transcript_49232/g.90812  ORF Transcript_49232/g.90812 Transcript_49232/m.90812 type:complete len:302 (+) Transcript_49232:996-1901(+)